MKGGEVYEKENIRNNALLYHFHPLNPSYNTGFKIKTGTNVNQH